MRHAIRALGVATSILWITFLFFIVTAGYSALNFNVTPEAGQASASDGVIEISVPFRIENGGFYELTDLNLTTRVLEQNGILVSKSTTSIPQIPRGSNLSKSHRVFINVREFLTRFPKYLIEDSNLTLEQTVQVRFAQVIPFKVSANTTMSWGAPVRDPHAKLKTVRPYNSTHSEVTFEIHFENGSPYFHVVGTMKAEIRNKLGETLASSETSLSVASRSVFVKEINVLAEKSKITRNGEIFLYFKTSMFEYGPLVISYEE